MAGRENLTDSEWVILRRGMEAAMHAISISHPGGTAQERLAITMGWAEAPRLFPGSDFVLELFEAMPDDLRKLNEQEIPSSSEDAGAAAGQAVELCKKAVNLLNAKAPHEREAYNKLVLFLATKVAKASKEGGFLGIGGQLVSAQEKAVIDRLAAVL